MCRSRIIINMVAVVAVFVCVCSAQAEVIIETVTIGNPGNAPDTRYDTAGYGGVDYVYEIGKFEVTAGQYTEFLNAVAAEDTYVLYSEYMGQLNFKGCNIQRAGSSPNYTYSVASDWADRPVNYVDWGGAARFANWMHNGQPTGAQDLTTTEDGSYYLNGTTSDPGLNLVVRERDATWVIPSEDEWYKAAYHYNDGVTGNYYDYPTSSDNFPSNDLIDPDPGNNANFYYNGYTIGESYYRTVGGEFENSDGPYHTFDQGGNVWEWTEGYTAPYRCMRGESFGDGMYEGEAMHAAFRGLADPGCKICNLPGFRVARVTPPDPVCGNGWVENGEECDDNNTDDGDGCSSTCTVEDGWDCSGEPSECTFTCGDGVIDTHEECDDGNTEAGDGCSSVCVVEAGAKCTGEPSVCVTGIPTVSEWGLVTMTLLVLAAGTMVLRRRRLPAA